MSSLKEQLMEIVASLPDDCTMDDFHYRLYMREKMEQSAEDIEAGRVHAHQEATEIVKSWRKSYGPTQP